VSALTVAIRRLAHGADLPLPAYATSHSAGLDLQAAVLEPVIIAPQARTLVATGIAIALPEGFEAQVRPRSGLAQRHGISVLNSPGTIDADYRGEIAVILVNCGAEPFVVERGMRIAQLVVAPVQRVAWREVADLATSGRAQGGFGSTGMGVRDQPPRKG
jgi:dUTP pyrophosphatase